MENIQYTEKIILFMDILGFKNIVEQKSPERIKSILEFIYKFLKEKNFQTIRYPIFLIR